MYPPTRARQPHVHSVSDPPPPNNTRVPGWPRAPGLASANDPAVTSGKDDPPRYHHWRRSTSAHNSIGIRAGIGRALGAMVMSGWGTGAGPVAAPVSDGGSIVGGPGTFGMSAAVVTGGSGISTIRGAGPSGIRA